MDRKCENCLKDCKQETVKVAYCPKYTSKSLQDALHSTIDENTTPDTPKENRGLKWYLKGKNIGE
jgi:hypothetical protein